MKWVSQIEHSLRRTLNRVDSIDAGPSTVQILPAEEHHVRGGIQRGQEEAPAIVAVFERSRLGRGRSPAADYMCIWSQTRSIRQPSTD